MEYKSDLPDVIVKFLDRIEELEVDHLNRIQILTEIYDLKEHRSELKVKRICAVLWVSLIANAGLIGYLVSGDTKDFWSQLLGTFRQ